jgi:hypothetical protein
MGRPKMKASKRRVQANISVHPEIAELAKKTDNQSMFYESSVEVARGLSIVMKKLESREMGIEDALEELSDIASVWDNNFEEFVPLEKTNHVKAI